MLKNCLRGQLGTDVKTYIYTWEEQRSWRPDRWETRTNENLLFRVIPSAEIDLRTRYDLEDQDRELARNLYFWEPLPFVDRAVFIAAPHRGSDLADSWIGRLGSSLMYVPSRLRGLVNRIRGRSGVRVEVPTSVDELSNSHPVMQTLIGLPMREGVTYHSIMGDVSGSASPDDWTDGVVPYGSSTLPGAASELVIPGADHGVHFDPRASAEVRRILRDALAPGR